MDAGAARRRCSATTTGSGAADLLRVTEAGTFEHGSSTLQLPVDPDDPAWWADVRARLLAARAGGPSRPGTTRW